MSLFHRAGYVVGVLITLLTLFCQARVHSHGRFVRIKGTRFVLHRSYFFFNGFNSYWMMHVAAVPSQRHKVSNTFREAAGAGLSVCRTWAFSDGGDRALQISPGVYDERVFQALGFVISKARRHGIRLILSFVNNHKHYGGRRQYVEWARNAGANVNRDDDFYTNPTVKKYYKNHVKKVITRMNTITRIAYKDDPTIMAWELMNEPRCQADYSGRMVYGWVQEMSSFVKSLDKKHLLEIGMEGFYGNSTPKNKVKNPPGYQVGTDFITNNLIKEIDFTTIHAYPDIWLSGKNDSAQLAFMKRWMKTHSIDSNRILKKPLVLAEFGKSSKDSGHSLVARDKYLRKVYECMNKFERSTGGGIGGSLVWQLMAEGMDLYGDGYGKSLDNKHLLEIGMEGFYGNSMPGKKVNNPGYQIGTDFIAKNLVKEIDFSTIHAHPDIWLFGQNDSAQMAFMKRWMKTHSTDSNRILKKPLVLAELGKSSKDSGHSLVARDQYLRIVYENMNKFEQTGAGIGGSLVWQLMAEGMELYGDGYGIILSQDASARGVNSAESHKMTTFGRMLLRRNIECRFLERLPHLNWSPFQSRRLIFKSFHSLVFCFYVFI